MRERLKCHDPKDESAFYPSPFFVNHICKEYKNADKRKEYAVDDTRNWLCDYVGRGEG